MLFLRLVSFILNTEGKKESKVFEETMVERTGRRQDRSVSYPPPRVEREQNVFTVRPILTYLFRKLSIALPTSVTFGIKSQKPAMGEPTP